MEDEEPGGSRRIQRMQTQPELLTHKNDSFSIVFETAGLELVTLYDSKLYKSCFEGFHLKFSQQNFSVGFDILLLSVDFQKKP